ncbi:hypothetical protein M5K25_000532 [Dendrobium thyrsiflorum]|uniref:Aminotransferase-like plant mobile domain-containing protein n=1 Tax=Dendrobium thyrsiflorum TaxID=117978 RepID=A0ABD0W787_DENTH
MDLLIKAKTKMFDWKRHPLLRKTKPTEESIWQEIDKYDFSQSASISDRLYWHREMLVDRDIYDGIFTRSPCMSHFDLDLPTGHNPVDWIITLRLRHSDGNSLERIIEGLNYGDQDILQRAPDVAEHTGAIRLLSSQLLHHEIEENHYDPMFGSPIQALTGNVSRLSSSWLQSIIEHWDRATNTCWVGPNEMTITLWDLYTIYGLPILGVPYEEYVPADYDLFSSRPAGQQRRGEFVYSAELHQNLRHYYDLYQHRRRGRSRRGTVSLDVWIASFLHPSALVVEFGRIQDPFNKRSHDIEQYSEDLFQPGSSDGLQPIFVIGFSNDMLLLARATSSTDRAQIQLFMFAPLLMIDRYRLIYRSPLGSLPPQCFGVPLVDSQSERGTPTLLSRSGYIPIATYLISMRPGWVCYRRHGSVILEGYNPNRAARQFGLVQATPLDGLPIIPGIVDTCQLGSLPLLVRLEAASMTWAFLLLLGTGSRFYILQMDAPTGISHLRWGSEHITDELEDRDHQGTLQYLRAILLCIRRLSKLMIKEGRGVLSLFSDIVAQIFIIIQAYPCQPVKFSYFGVGYIAYSSRFLFSIFLARPGYYFKPSTRNVLIVLSILQYVYISDVEPIDTEPKPTLGILGVENHLTMEYTPDDTEGRRPSSPQLADSNCTQMFEDVVDSTVTDLAISCTPFSDSSWVIVGDLPENSSPETEARVTWDRMRRGSLDLDFGLQTLQCCQRDIFEEQIMLLGIEAELRALRQRERALLVRRQEIREVVTCTEEDFSSITIDVEHLEDRLSFFTKEFDSAHRQLEFAEEQRTMLQDCLNRVSQPPSSSCSAFPILSSVGKTQHCTSTSMPLISSLRDGERSSPQRSRQKSVGSRKMATNARIPLCSYRIPFPLSQIVINQISPEVFVASSS